MYEFHYKYIKSKFDAKLLLTDANSLVYEIKIEDVYEDFCQDEMLFDFSDYPLDSKFFDPVNKKVIGKIEDEFKGRIISEFIRLKQREKECIKAKGVNKKIRQKEFVDVLPNK